MSTAALPTELESEIQQLKSDLAAAERARIRPEDAAADVIRLRLADAQHELFLQQELESRAIAEQQRARDLRELCELEQRANTAKNTLDNLRRTYSQLATQIQKSEFEHAGLLREYSRLKQQIGI